MSRFFTTLLLLALTLNGFSQEDRQVPVEFYNDQIVYLLGDSVNIRETPDIKGKTVAKLPIGTRLKILRKSDVTMDLNGFVMPWYQVQFDGKKKGYVWGGKIAMNSFRSTKNTDVVFHFGLEKEVDGFATFQIRVEKNHKEVQRIAFEGFGSSMKLHTCTNFGNRGLTTVDDVIYVTGNAKACADPGNDVIFFWSNDQLTKVEELTNMADVPVFMHEHFTFPSDMEGKKEVVILHEEAGEYLENEDPEKQDIDYSINRDTVFKWNGKELVKQK